MKIAHGTSYEQAERRLRDEVPGWDFDRVHAAARGEWANLLNRVQVTGGTAKQRKRFYTTLFQSFASPRLIAARGEQFDDTNGKVQNGKDRKSVVEGKGVSVRVEVEGGRKKKK